MPVKDRISPARNTYFAEQPLTFLPGLLTPILSVSSVLLLGDSGRRSAAGSAGPCKTLQGSATRPIWLWSDVGQGPVCCLRFSASIVKRRRRRNVSALPPSIFCADLVYWVRLCVTAGHALRCAASVASAALMVVNTRGKKGCLSPADVTMDEQSAARWQTPTSVSPSTWFPCGIDMHEVMRSCDPAQ